MNKESATTRSPVNAKARLAVTLSPRGLDLSDLVTDLSLLARAGASRPALVGGIRVGRLEVGPRHLDVKGVQVRLGRSELTASARVGLGGDGKVEARIRSERVDVDDLERAVRGASKGSRKQRRKGKFAEDRSERAEPGRTVSLDLEAAEVIFRKRAFTKVSARIEHGGGRTVARSVALEHAGGEFQGEAEVWRAGETVSWRGSGRAVFQDVDSLVQALGGSRRALSGRLTGRFDLRSGSEARGAQDDGPKRRSKSAEGDLVGSFEVDLTDGRLRTVRLAASALVPGLSETVGNLLGKKLGWEEEGILFQGAHAEGRLAGGRLELKQLDLKGPGIEIRLVGSLALKGLAADLEGTANIALPRLVRRLPGLGGAARLGVPLRITGPLARPAISTGRPVAEEEVAAS